MITDSKLRVSDQNGISLLHIMLEIHYSGQESSKWSHHDNMLLFFFFLLVQSRCWVSKVSCPGSSLEPKVGDGHLLDIKDVDTCQQWFKFFSMLHIDV